jgi:hypothetical protein
MVEMVMAVSSLLMGDEAFFLLGDGCFFGNLTIFRMNTGMVDTVPLIIWLL